jgi:gliding motility-associated-like protein
MTWQMLLINGGDTLGIKRNNFINLPGFLIMRQILLVGLFSCFLSLKGFSQTYALNSTINGQTISTCSGFFYDSGTNVNYGNNEDYTVTFCPGTPNKTIRLDFTFVELAFNDSLTIYDGQTTSSPVLLSFDYLSTNASFVTATNTSGCITVRFKSDATATARGWQATIRCVPPCQAFTGTLVSSPAADANGVVTVCMGDQVTLTANMSYPSSGSIYTQTDAISFFRWKPGFANDTSGIGLNSITRKITQHAGYRVDVLVIDSNGCAITHNLAIKVRTSTKPVFNITQPPSICLGDTVSITSPFQVIQGAYLVPPFSGDSLFLPDGAGVTYSDTIRITDFPPGKTLTNINDFLGVFINMEHSYMGDLQMKLIAPNGASVTLKQYPAGGGTFLGEPVDNDATPNIPGRGYLYGFTPTPTFGTMLAEASLHRHTYTDVTGRVYTNVFYLPEGNYTPFTSLSALVGTPLNGNWVIQIKDNLQSDNGFIFNWYLSFASNLYPNVETYSIPPMQLLWQPAASVINSNGATASFSPQSAGIANYIFKVVDSANCVFDTTIKVTVNPLPNKPDLGTDKLLCGSSTLNLSVSNPVAGVQYVWSTGASGASINIAQSGTYHVVATNSNGCKSRDTIVVVADPGVTVSLGGDTSFCASHPNILSAATTGIVGSYKWSDNTANAVLPITKAGKYWVEVMSNIGCRSSDTIIIDDNPINTWKAPGDTSICGTGISLTLSGYPLGTTFLWNDGVTGVLHNFNATGLYGVTANYIGCLKQDDINIGVHPVPTVNLGNDTFYCASNPNILTPDVTGNISTFTWNTGANTSSLAITTTGKYWLDVISDKGCKSVDTINISNNSINGWKAPNDTSICGTGLTITLSGYPAGTTFLWSDGATGVTHNFISSGLYGVTANYIGCLKQDNIDVGVHSIPIVSLGNDTFYCESKPNILRSNITGNISTFTWNTGANTPDLPITTTGIYWLEATTAFGCKHRDSIDVTTNPINSWRAVGDASICDRTTHTVSLNGYPSGTHFTWFDGSTSSIHDFTSAGTYKVTADYIGCIKQDSVAITVRPLPIIEVGRDTTLCMGFSLPLQVAYPGATFLWSTGEKDSSIVVISGGLYTVEAALNGCTYSDNIIVTFVDCNCKVSVPNAFSPNKDGINDLLRVHIECMPKNYKLSVFNRYGQTVFETSDMYKGWNGEIKGKAQPVGTYYYILTYYNDGLKRNELYKGFVVLLR